MSSKSSVAAFIDSHVSVVGKFIESCSALFKNLEKLNPDQLKEISCQHFEQILTEQLEPQKVSHQTLEELREQHREILMSLNRQQLEAPIKERLITETLKPLHEQLIQSYLSVSKLELSELIDALEELPIIPILPDTNNMKHFLKNRQSAYKAQAVWLKAILLDPSTTIIIDSSKKKFSIEDMEIKDKAQNELPKFSTDLHFNFLQSGSHAAALSYTTLQLARKTFSWSNDLQALFPSAEVLWICCEFSESRLFCRESGITGKPVIRSKTRTLDYTTEFIEKFQNLELVIQAKVTEDNYHIIEPSESIANILFSEASRLYNLDNSEINNYLEQCFFDSGVRKDYLEYYEDYWRFLRCLKNKIKNNSRFQWHYLLPDDQAFKTEQNNKIPKEFAPPRWQRKINEGEM
jgi:hypothetical protein